MRAPRARCEGPRVKAETASRCEAGERAAGGHLHRHACMDRHRHAGMGRCTCVDICSIYAGTSKRAAAAVSPSMTCHLAKVTGTRNMSASSANVCRETVKCEGWRRAPHGIDKCMKVRRRDDTSGRTSKRRPDPSCQYVKFSASGSGLPSNRQKADVKFWRCSGVPVKF